MRPWTGSSEGEAGLFLLAERAGREVGAQAEETAEIGRVLELKLVGDLRDGERRINEKTAGFEEEAVVDVIAGGAAGVEAEFLVQVGARDLEDARVIGDLLQAREVFIEGDAEALREGGDGRLGAADALGAHVKVLAGLAEDDGDEGARDVVAAGKFVRGFIEQMGEVARHVFSVAAVQIEQRACGFVEKIEAADETGIIGVGVKKGLREAKDDAAGLDLMVPGVKTTGREEGKARGLEGESLQVATQSAAALVEPKHLVEVVAVGLGADLARVQALLVAEDVKGSRTAETLVVAGKRELGYGPGRERSVVRFYHAQP